MNPADPRHPWQRLAAASRRASDNRETSAPFGFATRVAARALERQTPFASLFERFSLRALGIACLLAVGTVAVNYAAIRNANQEAEFSVLTEDPVAAVLDLS